MTLADVAEKMDCTMAFVSAIERGERNPPNPEWVTQAVGILGASDQCDKFVLLANKSRGTVAMNLKGMTESEETLFAVLARMNADGSLAQIAPEILAEVQRRGRSQ